MLKLIQLLTWKSSLIWTKNIQNVWGISLICCYHTIFIFVLWRVLLFLFTFMNNNLSLSSCFFILLIDGIKSLSTIIIHQQIYCCNYLHKYNSGRINRIESIDRCFPCRRSIINCEKTKLCTRCTPVYAHYKNDNNLINT